MYMSPPDCSEKSFGVYLESVFISLISSYFRLDPLTLNRSSCIVLVNSRLERGTLLPLVCSSSRCDSVLVRILWLSILALPESFPRELICEALPARHRCLYILYVTCIGENFLGSSLSKIVGICPCYKSGAYIYVSWVGIKEAKAWAQLDAQYYPCGSESMVLTTLIIVSRPE